jgi:hypothetical protein
LSLDDFKLARTRLTSHGPPDGSNSENNVNRRCPLKGGRIMMPCDIYRLYQIERAKSPAEVRRADEPAARLASAASSLFRGIARPSRAMRKPSPIATRDIPRPAD